MNKDVKYLTPKRSVKEIHGTQRRAASAQAVAELMFVKAAQEQQQPQAIKPLHIYNAEYCFIFLAIF